MLCFWNWLLVQFGVNSLYYNHCVSTLSGLRFQLTVSGGQVIIQGTLGPEDTGTLVPRTSEALTKGCLDHKITGSVWTIQNFLHRLQSLKTLDPLDPGKLWTMQTRDPGTSRLWDSEQRDHWDIWTLRSYDPGTLGPQDPKTLGPQDPKTLGPQDPKTLGIQNLRILGPQ